MTTDTSTTRGASRSTTDHDEGPAATAKHVADTVAGAAGEVTARIPDVANNTRDALTEANRMVQGGSDQTLKLVGATVIGVAVGLLIGGANRLLVIAALLPAAVIGATLLERIEGRAPGTSRLQQR